MEAVIDSPRIAELHTPVLPEPALMGMITEVEKQFAALVVNARNVIRDRAAEVHPELQAMGFKVLSVISKAGPQHQGCIAGELRVDKSVMSRAIKQLEELGLVTRAADPIDGRAMVVELTPFAQERMDNSALEGRKVLIEKLSVWGLEDVTRFADLLQKLNQTVI